MDQSLSWEATSTLAIQEVPQNFKEPEGALLHSQELSTGPYPEPDESGPYHPILFLQDPFLCYSPTYIYAFLVVSFLMAFPPKSYMYYSSLCVLHAQTISPTFSRSF
jgi:hypothetical protein